MVKLKNVHLMLQEVNVRVLQVQEQESSLS